MNTEKVSCLICHIEFSQITKKHLLNEHGITKDQYRTLFPGAKLKRRNENSLKALASGAGTRARVELSKKQTKEKTEIYYSSPKLCKECGKIIPYKKRKNNFCNHSCCASFNDTRRIVREESNIKRSKAAKSRLGHEWTLQHWQNRKSVHLKRKPRKLYCDIDIRRCPVCNSNFCVSHNSPRKSCGKKECRTYLSVGCRNYQNGSRKPTWYFNKTENKQVLLESSWEVKVAKLLDSKNIVWIRPKPIKWYDQNNKERFYFPDFYLPNYNMYLDPKNPYCMKVGAYKMSQVEKIISVIYGDIKIIYDYINNISKS